MTIRAALDKDLSAIFRLSRRVHLGPSYTALIPREYRAEYEKKFTRSDSAEQDYISFMKARIHDTAWQVVVAETEGEIVGYAQSQRLNPSLVRLKGLFVDHEHQGKGIGGALFTEQMRFARPGDTVEFEVIETNEPAISLYKKHGFVADGRGETPYYGARMLRMKKLL